MNLYDIIAEILKVPKEKLSRETCKESIEEWTSLRHMMLISSIEKKYNIRFSIGEIKRINSVGDFADILLKKGIIDAAI